jgi:hypothetical protein
MLAPELSLLNRERALENVLKALASIVYCETTYFLSKSTPRHLLVLQKEMAVP